MTTVTKLPTAAARELAKSQVVKLAERVARQLLAIGLLEHPRKDELVARINGGELLPRVEIRLSGSGPLLVVWGDLADDEGPPVWLFAAGDLGDLGDLEQPDLEGKATPCPGSGRLN